MKCMVKLSFFWLVALLCFCSCGRMPQTDGTGGSQGKKVKAVVVTAGHGFERAPFFAIFDGFDNVDYTEAAQSDDSEIFEDISQWDYDVMVLYSMTQRISPKRRANFVRLLERGVGLVALHHCIAAFQDWPEYQKIIGGKYYLKAAEQDGVKYPAGTYKHGRDMIVRVADSSHPVTKGIRDFAINDETYKNCVFEKDNHILLSTEEPTSDGPLCWVRRYGKARVCYIQLGHGRTAYSNEDYRLIIRRAIDWCAGKEQ